MAHRRYGVLVALGALAVAVPASAILVPSGGLREACAGAELIAIGSAASIRYAGPSAGSAQRGLGQYVAAFDVEAVIGSGDALGRISVEYLGPRQMEGGVVVWTGPMREWLEEDERVIVFLLGGSEPGVYELQNPWNSVVQVSGSMDVRSVLTDLPPGAEPDDSVAALLIASLADPSPKVVSCVVTDLVGLRRAERPRPDEPEKTPEELAREEGKRRVAVRALEALRATTEDRMAEALAMAGMFGLGDVSRMPEAAEFLRAEPDSDADVLRAQKELAFSIGRITGREAVPALYPLLEHEQDFVRREAARAIGEAGLRSAVPHLAASLQDSDQDTRYHCVRGLTRALGWGPRPLSDEFREDESSHIGFWQTWWEQTGRYEPWFDVEERAGAP
jgi:hypothetical protein